MASSKGQTDRRSCTMNFKRNTAKCWTVLRLRKNSLGTGNNIPCTMWNSWRSSSIKLHTGRCSRRFEKRERPAAIRIGQNRASRGKTRYESGSNKSKMRHQARSLALRGQTILTYSDKRHRQSFSKRIHRRLPILWTLRRSKNSLPSTARTRRSESNRMATKGRPTTIRQQHKRTLFHPTVCQLVLQAADFSHFHGLENTPFYLPQIGSQL